MTKSLFIATCALASTLVAAQPQDKRSLQAPAESSLGAFQAAGQHHVENADPRPAIPLRDSVRQSWSEPGDKPYRLSSEERQRMREQLRAQSALVELPPK